MKIKRIAHLGIAVKDLDPPKKLYTENLGLKLGGEEVVEAQKVKVSFIKVGESQTWNCCCPPHPTAQWPSSWKTRARASTTWPWKWRISTPRWRN